MILSNGSALKRYIKTNLRGKSVCISSHFLSTSYLLNQDNKYRKFPSKGTPKCIFDNI